MRRLMLLAAGVMVAAELSAGCGVAPQADPQRIDVPSPPPVRATTSP